MIAYLSISWASPSKEVSISVKGGQNAYYSKHFSQDCAMPNDEHTLPPARPSLSTQVQKWQWWQECRGGTKLRIGTSSTHSMYFSPNPNEEDITNMMVGLGSLVTISFGSKVSIPEEGYKVDHLKSS